MQLCFSRPDTGMEMTLRSVIAKANDFAARLKHTRIYDQRIEYQLQEFAILRKVVEAFSVDCVFDIGANQGQYAECSEKR